MKTGYWTQEELDLLYANADLYADELAALLDRSPTSIRCKARYQGFAVKNRARSEVAGKRAWTPAEDEVIRRHAETKTADQIADLLEDRSHKGVYRRSLALGVRIKPRRGGGKHKGTVVQHWTKADIEFLQMHLREMTARQMAKKLGRSIPSLKCKASELGLKFQTKHTINGIAKLLGVHSATVARYRDKLGMKWRQHGRFWRDPTDEEIQALARAILENPDSTVGDRTGRTSAKRLRLIADGLWDEDTWDILPEFERRSA